MKKAVFGQQGDPRIDLCVERLDDPPQQGRGHRSAARPAAQRHIVVAEPQRELAVSA